MAQENEIKNTETTAEQVAPDAVTPPEKPADAAKEQKQKAKKEKTRELEAEILKLKDELENSKKALSDCDDKYKRVLAEYDNYRKRTAKEKEGLYSDAYGDVIKEILPVIDNLERAAACSEGEQVMKGVSMTLTQFEAALGKLGLEAIAPAVGDAFDPEIHNAVMHTEDPELGENTISNVLQKGYRKGDKIYRYAMVAVAN